MRVFLVYIVITVAVFILFREHSDWSINRKL